ncbi:hypothetical protein DHW03_15470 [Pedobacter yonginense]|uniref:Uncharacterized protein n=2 Tax=Pedobacter yonginense TaxID=651869 RepID=A0A317EHR4_9SPHI|nr:hypothetical protein DHW03_15470 [Pedobacter yonginense]
MEPYAKLPWSRELMLSGMPKAISMLELCGLNEPGIGKRIKAIIDYPEGPDLMVERIHNGKTVDFYPMTDLQYGPVRIDDYAVEIPNGDALDRIYFPVSVHISQVLRLIDRPQKLRDLSRQASSVNPFQKQIDTVRAELHKIGLDGTDSEKQIREFFYDPQNAEPILISRAFQGKQREFEIFIEADAEMNFHLFGYALILNPDYGKLVHTKINGVDSRKIEERMKKVDWSLHSGHFFSRDYMRPDPLREEMDKIMKELYRFTNIDPLKDEKTWARANEIVDQLMYRYLKGMPLEKSILRDIPFRRETFYRSVYFPPGHPLGRIRKPRGRSC